MKTLLVAVGLCAGTSAWAAVTPFSESYSSTSTATGWSTSTSGRFTPTILNESDNYFLSVAQTERNNNGATVTGTVISGKAAAGDNYTLTFDMRLSSSSDQTNTEFKINDAANTAVIFSLKETTKWTTTWTVNGTSTQVTLPNSNKADKSNTIADVTWCSYKITRSGSKTYLTITNKETSAVIFSQAAISGSSTDGGLGNIVFVSSRYLANFAIDNIVVREVEVGDVPSTYTATFTNITSGNNPTVAIYTDSERTTPISNGSLEDGETYYFTATETNYNDYLGSFTVTGADPSLSFSMTLKPAYTINAVAEGTIISTIATGYAAQDETYGAYTHKAINYNGQYYLLDDATNANLSDYYASYKMGNSGDEVKEINYTLDASVVAFWEGESMSNVGHSFYNTRDNLSGASGGRVVTPYSGTSNGIKPNSTIDKGVYDISIAVNRWADQATNYTLQYSLDGETWNDIETVSFTSTSNETYIADNILIPGNSYLRLLSPGGTPRHSIDYILADKVGEASTIGAEGYSTFASAYPLDLTAAAQTTAGITAYKASVSGNKVNFTAIDQTVAANTGFLLEGTAGATVKIPVAATGTAVAGNEFLVNEGGATFTADADYYYFGLMKDTDLEFGTFDPATLAIPADKAYLKVLKTAVDGTARLEIVFADEATGIANINVNDNENRYYNLNGQRISQPTRGLYIMNGKKYVVK